MTTQRIFLSCSKLTAFGAAFAVLNLLAMAGMVLGQQLKPAPVRDAPRVQRTAPGDSKTSATRQRFLEMFARTYYPGARLHLTSLLFPSPPDTSCFLLIRSSMLWRHLVNC
jgi:hypothetical protein